MNLFVCKICKGTFERKSNRQTYCKTCIKLTKNRGRIPGAQKGSRCLHCNVLVDATYLEPRKYCTIKCKEEARLKRLGL